MNIGFNIEVFQYITDGIGHVGLLDAIVDFLDGYMLGT
jgi:hypothetical protein